MTLSRASVIPTVTALPRSAPIAISLLADALPVPPIDGPIDGALDGVPAAAASPAAVATPPQIDARATADGASDLAASSRALVDAERGRPLIARLLA
jgi:hypothetical protein